MVYQQRENIVKIGCLIYAYGSGYERLAQCARDSFAKFHPDVKTIVVTDKTIDEYDVSKDFDDTYFGYHGIYRYAIALEIMKKNDYDKMIILGADTVTCARLTEFIDENDIDILATSDADYQTSFFYKPENSDFTDILHGPMKVDFDKDAGMDYEYVRIFNGAAAGFHNLQRENLFAPMSAIRKVSYENINADVVCFNGPTGLDRVIKESLNYCKTTLDYWRSVVMSWNPEELADLTGELRMYAGNWSGFLRRILFDDSTDAPGHKFDLMGPPIDSRPPRRRPFDRREKLESSDQQGAVALPDPKNFYGEQAGLNIVNILSQTPDTSRTCFADDTNISDYLSEDMIIPDIKIKIIDGETSSYHYNIGSRLSEIAKEIHRFYINNRAQLEEHKILTNPALETIAAVYKDYFINTKRFSVKDEKLFTSDGKQIKLWHYCHGFRHNKDIEEIINSYIFYGFNNETKEFFKQHCGCGSFFEKQLVI